MVEVAAQSRSAGQARRADATGYRPDIDGLRGVAVIMVVLWHAGVRGLGGGYAGVDAFFVISGYVITGSLLRDARGRGLSILRFYERRLRRIAPAFLAMLAAVLAAGFVIQFPGQLTRSAGVAMGALGLSANLVLWRLGGYFGPSVETEPLRHVWSLSIEEQFYLVYPALLALLLARAPKSGSAVLAAVAAGSLGLYLFLFRHSPEAAFELGPARAWELMIGCLCALQVGRWRAPSIVDEALTLLGAALLAAAALGLARNEPLTILTACFGAALLVLCGQRRPLVSRALAGPPLLLVGLASYSLYLWHWPLLALAHSLRPTGIGPAETALLLAAGAVLGFASWRFIEQPLRRPWPDRAAALRFFAICGALAAFSLGAAALALAGGGLPGRFPPRVAALAAYEDFHRTPAWPAQYRAACFPQRVYFADYDTAACFTAAPGRANVLLWGDSHAGQLAAPLADLTARLGAHFMQATMPACPPTTGGGNVKHDCGNFNKMVMGRLAAQHVDVAILSAVNASRRDDFVAAVDALTRRGAKVIVVGPTQKYSVFVAPTLARQWPAPPDLDPWMMRKAFADEDAMRTAIAARPGVAYVSVIDLFCPHRRCALFTPAGAPLIWDRGHLTPDAAQVVVARITAPLAAALGARSRQTGAPASAPTPAPLADRRAGAHALPHAVLPTPASGSAPIAAHPG